MEEFSSTRSWSKGQCDVSKSTKKIHLSISKINFENNKNTWRLCLLFFSFVLDFSRNLQCEIRHSLLFIQHIIWVYINCWFFFVFTFLFVFFLLSLSKVSTYSYNCIRQENMRLLLTHSVSYRQFWLPEKFFIIWNKFNHVKNIFLIDLAHF